MRTPISMAMVAMLLFVAPTTADDQVDVISVRLLTKATNHADVDELEDRLEVPASRLETFIAVAGSHNRDCFLLHITAMQTINVECSSDIRLMENEKAFDKSVSPNDIVVAGCQSLLGQAQGEAWIKVRIPQKATMFIEVRAKTSAHSNRGVSLSLHPCKAPELTTFRDKMELAIQELDETAWRPLAQQHD